MNIEVRGQNEWLQDGQLKRTNEASVVINTESQFIKSLNLKQLLMVGQVSFGDKISDIINIKKGGKN